MQESYEENVYREEKIGNTYNLQLFMTLWK